MSKNIVEINTLNISNAVVNLEKIYNNSKLTLVLADILKTYYKPDQIKNSNELQVIKEILKANNAYFNKINQKAEKQGILDLFNNENDNKITTFDVNILYSIIENNQVIYKKQKIIIFETITNKKFLKNYQEVIDFDFNDDIDGPILYNVLLSINYYVNYVKTLIDFYLD